MAPNTDDFNPDELEAPQWLNAEFLTKVLHNCEKNAGIQVKSFKITPGTAKEFWPMKNVFGPLCAVVDYQQGDEEKSKSIIIKTMPEVEGNKLDLLQESYIFETEIGMYSEVIPKFEAILRASGDNTVLGARCLYHSLSPKKLIVFEDLVPQGYVVMRDRQANMDEAKLVYMKLAKWHAISYKLNLEEPSFFDIYKHSFMTMPNLEDNEFITGGCKLFLEMLESVPSLLKYKPYFEKLQPLLHKISRDSFLEYRENPQANSHYVLNHGDLHCKNMMFKRNADTDKVEDDVMLLDFQITYVGPIVNDLLYSKYMVLDDDLRTKHLDELFYFYFTVFIDTLKQIGYDGELPKLTELREQLMRHSHFDIFLLVTFLPIWYGFAEGKNDPEQIMSSAEYRSSLYYNKRYIEQLHVILPKMLHLGYFEKC